MATTFRTKAILLKLQPFGEVGQLATLYTESHGKVQAQVRGSKKIVSKLCGSLQFFCMLDVMIAHGKQFDHLAGIQIIDAYSAILNDYQRRLQAVYGLEMIEKLTGHAERDLALFNLLGVYLQFINEHELAASNWQQVKDRFIKKLLTQLGYQPPADITESGKLRAFLYDHLHQELRSERLLDAH